MKFDRCVSEIAKVARRDSGEEHQRTEGWGLRTESRPILSVLSTQSSVLGYASRMGITTYVYSYGSSSFVTDGLPMH